MTTVPVGAHAADLQGDRRYGRNEEENFIHLLQDAGYPADFANDGVVLEIKGSRMILPDTRSGNIYFENKIKYPTAGGKFGLEQYRFDSLRKLMQQPGYENIYYVINPNVRSNARNAEQGINNIRRAGLTPGQRIIAHMGALRPDNTFMSTTYRAGRAVEEPVHYFHARQFDVLDLAKLLG